MEISGHLRKMIGSHETPVRYQLRLDEQRVALNDLIGSPVALHHSGEIHCIACGRRTRKSYNQGYCYPCFISLAACDMCIMKPETCHFHLGTCREPEWARDHCMQDHIVYLANSSGIKVGITRASQVPTRWIDQGASQALPVFRVRNRMLSGKIEVAIGGHVSDRTDWRKMLRSEPEPADLGKKRDELLTLAQDRLQAVRDEHGGDSIEYLPDAGAVSLQYPVQTWPEKIRSLNFDKTATIEGRLQGIKGQYLILDRGVLNIRKFGGYQITFRH